MRGAPLPGGGAAREETGAVSGASPAASAASAHGGTAGIAAGWETRLPPALRTLLVPPKMFPSSPELSPGALAESGSCPGPNLLRSGDISTLLRKLLR